MTPSHWPPLHDTGTCDDCDAIRNWLATPSGSRYIDAFENYYPRRLCPPGTCVGCDRIRAGTTMTRLERWRDFGALLRHTMRRVSGRQ